MSDYTILNVDVTLFSISLLPSEIISISLRLITITNILALAGLAPHSSNKYIFWVLYDLPEI